jgi:selenocysteine lyase/cysteine desulfurase
MLSCQKALFSLPEGMHYLNCSQLSPLLKSVEAAGIEGIRRKVVPTRLQPSDWFTGSEELRGMLARLVNAHPDQIAHIPSVSYGVAIASSHVRLKPGQNVVLPAAEFPSNVYGWMSRCKRDGGKLRFVPRPEPTDGMAAEWSRRIVEAIDRDTAVVSLTVVHWTDGTRFDLAAVGRRAREVGAWFIVDGTQSVGALPFDFTEVQPDLLVCAGYKWLLGPYQYGFAAFGPRMMEAEPLELNWVTREGSEDFTRLTHYREGFQPGARRFDAGEHANFILVPMLSAAIRQILAWGVPEIQAYCADLAQGLAGALGEGPFRLAAPRDRAGHMFGVRVPPGTSLPKLVEELKRRDVHVSVRGNSVRVSPHVYNTPEDLLALAEALSRVA